VQTNAADPIPFIRGELWDGWLAKAISPLTRMEKDGL